MLLIYQKEKGEDKKFAIYSHKPCIFSICYTNNLIYLQGETNGGRGWGLKKTSRSPATLGLLRAQGLGKYISSCNKRVITGKTRH